MTQSTDIETRNYRRKIIIIVALFTAFTIIGGIFLPRIYWPVGFAIWLFLVIVGTGVLVRWHAKNTAYICPKCGHTFAVTTLEDLMSPHMGIVKLLTCPKCVKSSWCEGISIKSMKDEVIVPGERVADKPKPATSLYVQIGIVIFAYLLLWAHTAYIYPQLPEIIPTHFGVNGPDAWGHKSSILEIPLIAALFPVLHGSFSLYAIRKGYRSGIYVLLTVVFIKALLIFMIVQYAMLSHVLK